MPASPPAAPTSDTLLTLRTLGGTAVLRPGHPEPLIGPGKPAALLAYLACAPRRTAGRDHLIDLLWADLDPERARHALRQTVWYLKRQTGRPLVESENGHLLLATDVACDRDAFLDAIESREMARAVELYAGPFVPDFAAPGGAEFEKWADMERYRLQALFQQAAEETVRAQLARGNHREAVTLARRTRTQNPAAEAAWRLLFEALLSAGDRVALTIEREAFERLLATEGLSAEPATTALLARLDGGDGAPDTDPASPRLAAELVGREAEFGQVIQAWERARTGTAVHVHLSGVAGVGKSRLLTDIGRRLTASGARVAQVRAAPASRTLSYGLAGDLAAALAALPGALGIPQESASALVALNPALANRFPVRSDAATGEEAARRRTLALADLLAAVADEAPVALIVDDLHWADPASRAVLAGLLDRLDGMRVLVLTAARPAGEGTAARSDSRRLDLAPLDQLAIGALLTSLADLPVVAWADALPATLHRSTGGVPLDVLETLQLAHDAGALGITDGSWVLHDPAELDRLLVEGSALEHRIRRLDRATHWALLLLSVAGTPVAEDDLVAMGGADVLPILEQRGLLTRTANLIAPAHDEVARWTWEVASPEARAAARRVSAEHLLAASGDDRAGLARALRMVDPDADPALTRNVAVRLMRRVRQEGDRRPARTVLRELLADDPGILRIVALLDEPLGTRLPRSAWWWSGAAAFVVLALGGSIAYFPTHHRPGAQLSRWYIPGRRDRAILGPSHLGPLDAREEVLTLPALTDSTVIPSPPGAGLVGMPRLRSDGTAALQVEYPDSGGVDIVVRGPAGEFTRLTDDPEDDNVAGWSPDGRWLIGTTGRNSPPGTTDYDIFAMDPRTREIRFITTGRDHDQGPEISPDGTRIAFIRMSLDTIGPRRFCVSWFDGSEARCLSFPDGDAESVLGWVDRHQVVVMSRDVRGLQLETLDIATFARRPLRRVTGSANSLSPDGQWILCNCREEDGGRQQLFAVAAPSRLIDLHGQGRDSSLALAWDERESAGDYLDRLALSGPTNIPTGGTGRFNATGVSARGSPYGDLNPRWSSRDTSIASIDARTGVARAKRVGTVWLLATTGGWRTDSLALTVIASHDVTVASEEWAPGWEGRWVPWGTPRPYLKEVEGGPALHIAGDGSYHSGVSRWPGWTGGAYGVEITAHVRYDRVNWQTLSVDIDRGTDSLAFASWDRTTGSFPGGFQESCTAGLGGESLFWRSHLGVRSSDENAAPQIPDDLARGARWFQLRLQVFPDGRCGVAVDGIPLWQSTAPTQGRFRPMVSIHGMSYRTDVLVRRIETWTGVRNDIDWTKAPTTVDLGH